MKILSVCFYILVTIALALAGCSNQPDKQQEAMMYTCPMPEDSVFSDKPGKCPKCGMELIEVQHEHGFSAEYTCSMHPEILKESPGKCPICGMDLVKKTAADGSVDPGVHTVIRSTDAAVVTSLPVTTIEEYSGESETEVFGSVGYDPRQVGSISSYVSGRIEKLYLRYRFQPVKAGQAVMEIYSPELQTAQQELLFLLQSDPSNSSIINAAKDKLLLLGMSARQLNSVIHDRKAANSVTVYSRYSGHIHEAGNENMDQTTPMKSNEFSTNELAVREGAYVQKGNPVFNIVDHHTVWAIFQLRPGEATTAKIGDKITIRADREGNHELESTIRFIDPFPVSGDKLLTLRASLEGHQHLPAGTPLKGVIKEFSPGMRLLPRESIVSLGVRNIVYVRKSGMVKPIEVLTGRRLQDKIEIISGISRADSVIVNGQFLADNETLIRIKK